MSINRREFVILSCAAAAGCSALEGNQAVKLQPAAIDAGPVTDYSAEGVYDRFRMEGFFIIRRGNDLFALSSVCTHRHCKVKAEPDHSFYCRCHGSAFDPIGKVVDGPATRPLPTLPTSVDSNGHLIVLGLAVA